MGFFSTVLIIFKVSVLDAYKGGACKDDRADEPKSVSKVLSPRL